MTTTVHTSANSVTIERVYPTTLERLFRAWTDPELVARWLAPGPMSCTLREYEPRKGGRFHIEMEGAGPDGKPMRFDYEGTFDEVTPGKRIVMLWPPAAPPDGAGGDAPPSVVTITFTPVAGGTRLRLTQDGMPHREGAQNAGYGWQSAMEKLAGLLGS